jgi:hypothetical protein
VRRPVARAFGQQVQTARAAQQDVEDGHVIGHATPGVPAIFDGVEEIDREPALSSDLTVASPIASIARLVGAAPGEVLKDALRVAGLDAYGDVLPRAVADERFTFHGRLLSGLEQPEPR